MSKEIIKIVDFDINNTLLLEQFKQKTKAIEIMKSISKRSKDIEDAAFEIRNLFWINTAEGDQLDVLGKIHGIARDGRNDADYRDVIEVQIIINNGSGEHEIIIELVTSIFGVTSVQLLYLGKANLQIWADISLTTDNYLQLLDTVMAGVGLILVAGSGNPFVFFDDPDGAGYSYLESDELEIDSGDGTGIELLSIDSGTGAESLFVFNYQNLEGFEINFGSGVELFSVDFAAKEVYFLVNFISTMFGYQSTDGGEYQSILIT